MERRHYKLTLSLPSSNACNLQLKGVLSDTALQVFRLVSDISLPYLQGMFSCAVDITGRSGRNLRRLGAQLSRTVYLKHCMVLKLK